MWLFSLCSHLVLTESFKQHSGLLAQETRPCTQNVHLSQCICGSYTLGYTSVGLTKLATWIKFSVRRQMFSSNSWKVVNKKKTLQTNNKTRLCVSIFAYAYGDINKLHKNKESCENVPLNTNV